MKLTADPYADISSLKREGKRYPADARRDGRKGGLGIDTRTVQWNAIRWRKVLPTRPCTHGPAAAKLAEHFGGHLSSGDEIGTSRRAPAKNRCQMRFSGAYRLARRNAALH